MEQKSLLQTAKSIENKKQNRGVPDDDAMALALAWGRDEIGVTQICRAIWPEKSENPATVYAILARGFREAVRRGILK